MAAWGKPQWTDIMRDVLIDNDSEEIRFKMNLHTGLDAKFLDCATNEDIALQHNSLQNISYIM